MSTPTVPPNIAIVDLPGGQIRWLTDAAPMAADPAHMVEPTLVHCEARAGRRIPAYVYRPGDMAERIGVVLSIHGGPVHQERPGYQFDGFYQYLVSNGVAVIVPNIRGSQGYGISYQELIYRDWGGVDLQDWEDVTRWLSSQDWVDPNRIGLYGGSYGGFGVLTCLARLPELDWAAGVSWCGPSNLLTLASSSPPSWRTLVNRILGDPEQDAEFLLSRSPVTYADQIGAPLLVLQGANDPRVPQHESDQIVERLRARGVEVRYDVYPDEGHGFMRRENLAKGRTTAGEFLLAHLASGQKGSVTNP
jgi:dipeptidyl aminopeptidase/acylaminoacyl peptidase